MHWICIVEGWEFHLMIEYNTVLGILVISNNE